MIIAVWIVSALLAVAFAFSGAQKIFALEKYRTMGTWAKDSSDGLVRTIGVLEILGAIGLILPPLTGILPGLAIWAALGLALTMLVAIVVHIVQKDVKGLPVNIVLMFAALFVAAGWAFWV